MIITDARSRPARAFAAFFLLIALLGALLVAGPASPAHADDSGVIASRLNEARAASGLAPLARNGALDAVAAGWAAQMAASGALSHNPAVGGQIPSGWSRWGENVARGHGSGSAMHDGWWNSPGHQANMLGSFTDVGIAFLRADGTTWGVQVFATYAGGGGGGAQAAPAPRDAAAAEAARAADTARLAEEARVAEEARAAEAARLAELERVRAEEVAVAQAAELVRVEKTRLVIAEQAAAMVVAEEQAELSAEQASSAEERRASLSSVGVFAWSDIGPGGNGMAGAVAVLAGALLLGLSAMLVPGIRMRVVRVMRTTRTPKAIQVTAR